MALHGPCVWDSRTKTGWVMLFFVKLFIFGAKLRSMQDLPMRPGMETTPPTEEERTSREVLELGDS